MKPEQFIREWGIEYSRKYVALAESEGDILPWEKQLKQLIASLDLINHMGGLSEVKRKFRDNGSCHGERMKALIKDHESIYGGGDES
ncbi:hypothetical protein [Acinetobacter baumannii]